jgi:hypothetical protein
VNAPVSLLGLVGNPRFDTLAQAGHLSDGELGLVGNPRFDTLPPP